jgi:hypothetical protein
MPWYNGDYRPSYKNQPKYLRDKAVKIAYEVLRTRRDEGEAIATGLKQARLHLSITRRKFYQTNARKNKYHNLYLVMENEEQKSAEELKLRGWLTANDVYPNKDLMQSMVINSFYRQFEEKPDDDKLILLEDVDLNKSGISEGFDYRAHQKSDEEEDKEWAAKINYVLSNPGKFLPYINEMWR